MKKIEAIIRHFKLDPVKQALVDLGLEGMTVTEVSGCGNELHQQNAYRGFRYGVDVIPKIRVEVAVPDDQLDNALDAIAQVARTGDPGDGKLIVSDLARAIRIRTAESGEVAL